MILLFIWMFHFQPYSISTTIFANIFEVVQVCATAATKDIDPRQFLFKFEDKFSKFNWIPFIETGTSFKLSMPLSRWVWLKPLQSGLPITCLICYEERDLCTK